MDKDGIFIYPEVIKEVNKMISISKNIGAIINTVSYWNTSIVVWLKDTKQHSDYLLAIINRQNQLIEQFQNQQAKIIEVAKAVILREQYLKAQFISQNQDIETAIWDEVCYYISNSNN